MECHKLRVPVFVPAFSDCSAGFGIVLHQTEKRAANLPSLTFDSGADFRELTEVKLACKDTGLLMLGGGVPKNFAQDTVVAAELLGHEAPMHKYAVQITVADSRDGALSGSTLREACSWGKVDVVHEKMVFAEASAVLRCWCRTRTTARVGRSARPGSSPIFSRKHRSAPEPPCPTNPAR